jgi:hypothetical protein
MLFLAVSVPEGREGAAALHALASLAVPRLGRSPTARSRRAVGWITS